MSLSDLEHLPDKYSLVIHSVDETGVQAVQLVDKNTDISTILIIPNKDIDTFAIQGWAGARFSREDKGIIHSLKEIQKESEKNPEFAAEKLGKVFVNYNHASVGGLTHISIAFENLTMEEAFFIFNQTSIGDGQELSSRYVEIGNFNLPKLQDIVALDSLDEISRKQALNMYQQLQDYAANEYQRWYSIIENRTKEFIEAQIQDTGQKLKSSTLNARVLDIARLFIPLGSRTAMYVVSSVRGFIDIIQKLENRDTTRSNALASQIRSLINIKRYDEGKELKANLATLTKYSEGSQLIQENLDNLENYLKNIPTFKQLWTDTNIKININSTKVTEIKDISIGESLALPYLSVIKPDLDEIKLLEFLRGLDKKTQAEIGSIILRGHTQHDLMANIGDVRSPVIYAMETALAYVRDLNRHRAIGRLVHMFETKDVESILNMGFNANFQMNNAIYLKDLNPAWEESLKGYYYKLFEFYGFLKERLSEQTDMRFIYNLLPLAHQVKIHMSGPSTQWNYIGKLRRDALGGDFGYRDWVDQIIKEIQKDPYLQSMGENLTDIDANDVIQLLGRS